MFRIKRLYTFILQSFIPVFAMTFGICLFIVLMQFLWKYVEDLVGKGLGNLVLAELFFYAALNLIPLALPLALLLASLMTFGNMGERLELLAVKAAGVSLIRTMRPLIILVCGIAIGAFFFQNEAMPRINIKFRTLLMSVKQKSPELDIPEGSFYNGINNYSIYVKEKDPKTRMLRGVMIYDISQGFHDMSVFVCDSAKMQVSEAKDYLRLNLFDGQRFASFRDASLSKENPGGRGRNNQFVPYSRENFKRKEIIISFDANFNRLDESSMEGSQIGKNLKELNLGIDSLSYRLDSMNREDRLTMSKYYFHWDKDSSIQTDTTNIDSASVLGPMTFDSLVASLPRSEKLRFLENAKADANNNSGTFLFQTHVKSDLAERIRRHKIEWHQKFTLSFACLVFFFIGAPLGSIIRKGGLGTPVIVSVALFIVYYIFNNVGVKMARTGVWEVWQGTWLSSFVLFPLGVFLTYKAMNDSALFNMEVYNKFIRKILRIKTGVNQDNKGTTIDLNKLPQMSTLKIDNSFLIALKGMTDSKLKDIIRSFDYYGYDRDVFFVVLNILKDRKSSMDDVTIDIGNESVAKSIGKTFKETSIFTIITYILTLGFLITARIVDKDYIKWLSYASLIGYAAFYIKAIIHHADFYKSLRKQLKKETIIARILGVLCYPILYFYLTKKMKKELGK